MADIRLITILPTQTVQGVQQPVNAGAGSQANPVLANLPAGTLLSGFIINRDPSGNPVLRTEAGDITFASNFFLKIGSEVLIRVENAQNNTLAHILSVDGQPPEVAEAQSAFSQGPQVIVSDKLVPQLPLQSAGQAQAPSQAVVLPPAITVSGTLIAPHSTAPDQPPPLPVGTQVKLNIAGLTVSESSIPEEILQAAVTPRQAAQTTTAFYSAYARNVAANPVAAPPTAPAPPQAATLPAAPAAPAINAPAANTTTVPVKAAAPQTTPVTTANVAAPVVTQSNTTAAPAAPQTTPAAPAQPVQTTVIQTKPEAPQAAAAIPAAQPSALRNAAALIAAPQNPATPPAQQPPAATVQAPTITASAAPPPQQSFVPGQSVTAQVLGSEPTGEALLQTPIGVVRLQPGTVLPQGSTVTLNVVQIDPPEIPSANAATRALPQAPLTELARQWTALQEAFKLLAAKDVTLPQGFIPPSIPSISTNAGAANQPPNVSSSLLLFISALRGGDFAGWLGRDNVQWLKDQGHDALLVKAQGEFIALSRQMATPEPQHWQALFFPVAVDGELQQARLFVKRDRQKQGGNQQTRRNEDTRFVLEVDLSQMGEMQMDGFVRRREKEVQFDLVIRSLSPLPQDVQQDLLRIYNDTGQLTGYKGSLAFQAVREFPVHPMEEVIARGMGPVVA